MKRILSIVLALAMLALLGGCGGQNDREIAYSAKIGDVDATIIFTDPDNGRIVTDAGTYEFEHSEYSYQVAFTLTYPNGESTMLYKAQGAASAKWTDGASPREMERLGYLDINRACNAVEACNPVFDEGRKLVDLNWPLIGAALLIGIISIISVASPDGMWHFNIGWMFRNAEPSDLLLNLYRVFGYIGIVAAVIMLLVGVFW